MKLSSLVVASMLLSAGLLYVISLAMVSGACLSHDLPFLPCVRALL